MKKKKMISMGLTEAIEGDMVVVVVLVRSLDAAS